MGSLATSASPWASSVSRRAPSSRGDGMRLANAQEEMQGAAIGHHEVEQPVTVEIIDEESTAHCPLPRAATAGGPPPPPTSPDRPRSSSPARAIFQKPNRPAEP